MRSAIVIALSFAFFVLEGCAGRVAGVPVQAISCPVSEVSVARNIAVSVIAAHTGADHLNQTGYRLDLSDQGASWLAVDGPNVSTDRNGSIVAQFGGSSVRFVIAKCTGAISNFRISYWR